MASGDVVGLIGRIIPPATSYATPDARVGGSSPAESFPVWDFDDTTAEYLDLYGILSPSYAGGGLTIVLPWSATSATTNAVVWRAAFRRIADDAEDVDTSQTYDYNQATADTAPTASGEISLPTITFTNGADMDSLAAGEPFVLRVGRLPSDAGDTMTGDAELWPERILIKET